LYEAVQTVARGVSGRSTQPVQNNIYLEAKPEGLQLVATDLEVISIESLIEASVLEAGAVTVSARVLSEVAGNLPAGDVILEADERNAVSIACAKSHYSIHGMSARDFETLPSLASPTEFSIPQNEFHSILNQTAFATSRDETRPMLTGALFNLTPGQLQVVATDTYRLALRKAALSDAVAATRSAIISAKALNEVLRVIDAGSAEPITVRLADNQVEFAVQNVKIGSRLIEGQFPNYEKVIPSSSDKRVLAAVSDLTAALKRALIVARDDANRVVFRTSGNLLRITAEAQQVGNVDEEIEVAVEGEDAEIAFNARYMMDLLDSVKTDRVSIELTGPLNPGMMRPDGSDDYLYVLMPMQIM
jgi:DNA polymerase-3 subunit beta